jgi:hypothetical protein
VSRWKEVRPTDPVDPKQLRWMAQGSIVRRCEVFSVRSDRVAARLFVKRRQEWTWVRWHEWPVFATEAEAAKAARYYFDDNNPPFEY